MKKCGLRQVGEKGYDVLRVLRNIHLSKNVFFTCDYDGPILLDAIRIYNFSAGCFFIFRTFIFPNFYCHFYNSSIFSIFFVLLVRLYIFIYNKWVPIWREYLCVMCMLGDSRITKLLSTIPIPREEKVVIPVALLFINRVNIK